MLARALGTFALVAGLALAGCATNSAAGSSGPPPATTTTHSTPSPSPGATASETDNGRTITLAVGQRLTVTLHSTYWKFGDPTGAALHLAGQQTSAAPLTGPGHCMPGQGCGTVASSYDAVAPGTVTVTASRSSCGEARGCTGDQGSYRLVVIVH